MTIRETFTCPSCGAEKTRIIGAQALMDDVRFDSFECSECHTQWRVYFRVSDISEEVTFVPAPSTQDNTSESATQSVTE